MWRSSEDYADGDAVSTGEPEEIVLTPGALAALGMVSEQPPAQQQDAPPAQPPPAEAAAAAAAVPAAVLAGWGSLVPPQANGYVEAKPSVRAADDATANATAALLAALALDQRPKGEPAKLTALGAKSSSPAFEQLLRGLSGTVRDAEEKTERVLLVLDLNGLMVERVRKPEASKEERAQLGAPGGPVAAGSKYLCWLRPGAQDFATFLVDNFAVLPWSSAMGVNVDIMIGLTMDGHKDKLVDKFDQSHCLSVSRHPDNPNKPMFIKNLQAVWAKHPEFAARNTLLVDDSLYKAVLNPPHTAIHPRAWTRDQTEDTALLPGGRIRGYLERLAAASRTPGFAGVPAFVASNAFDTGYSPEEREHEAQVAEHARAALQARTYASKS